MTFAAEREFQHNGETMGCADHDHDLIQELSKRLDTIWRFDQYIENAEGKPGIQSLWHKLKKQEQDNVKELKRLIAEEIKAKCF